MFITKADMERLKSNIPYSSMVEEIVNGSHHPVDLALNRWTRYAVNAKTHIVEMHRLQNLTDGRGHESEALMEYIFCQIIPALRQTCKAIRNRELGIPDVSRSRAFPGSNYDMLAVRAYQKRLSPHKTARLSRTEVWDMIQHRQEIELKKNSSDFPLKCISSLGLHFLLKLSIDTESSVLPGQEDEHRREFDLAVSNGDFCSIDEDKALDHPDWRDFFRPFVGVAPFVAERSSYGRSWTPVIDRFTTINEAFFSYKLGRPHKPWLPQLDLLGFLNIPGTGASVLLDFLLKSHNELSFAGHLHSVPGGPAPGDDSTALVSCIFGSSEGMAKPASSPAAAGGSPFPRCPISARYLELAEAWLASLPRLEAAGRIAGPYNESSASDPRKLSSQFRRPTRLSTNGTRLIDEMYDETSDLQVSLTVAVMVRDPLDRLVSLFSDWKHHRLELEGQDALPEILEDWLQLVATHAKGLIPDQYRHLDEDLTRAASLISGPPSARALVLVAECWEASVLLASDRHPQALGGSVAGAAAALLPGGNKNGTESAISAASGVDRLVAGDDGKIAALKLRKQARSWFVDDYKFYDQAVKRFKEMLKVSNVPTEVIEECTARLDSNRQ
jgi:hypothetical protein